MVRRRSDRPREKCAVVGVSVESGETEAAQVAYQSLFALQHRGVEASGIVTTSDDKLHVHRESGMVRDVFQEQDIAALTGTIAVGHNRYSTSGGRNEHLQPVISDSINFAFAHNGNVPDTDKLAEYLAHRRYVTKKYNDSELFGMALASKLHGGRDVGGAIAEVSELAIGAYSCVASYDDMLVAFRDPHGIRPLELGSFKGGLMVASETCALDTVGANHIRSVEPGELLVMKDGKLVSSERFAERNDHLDVFELVYFARHDSMMNGQRVNEVRRKFGHKLAELHALWQDSPDNILVTAVPDTSIPAAEGYAEAWGLRNETAIIKNRYIGRTFMQPTQASRKNSLRLKHTMIGERIKDRDVYLIDDSIVRGNTLPRLVELARSLGARSVSVLIASPPIRFPDFYGVDTPQQSELMAANMSVEDMRQSINADYLGFLSVSAMVEATGIAGDKLNLASFTGEYPVSIGKQAATISRPATLEYMD